MYMHFVGSAALCSDSDIVLMVPSSQQWQRPIEGVEQEWVAVDKLITNNSDGGRWLAVGQGCASAQVNCIPQNHSVLVSKQLAKGSHSHHRLQQQQKQLIPVHSRVHALNVSRFEPTEPFTRI